MRTLHNPHDFNIQIVLFMKKLLPLFFFAQIIIACNVSNTDIAPSYFPFKESKNDRWGLVNASGKVLVADEFKEMPSLVYNGIFYVQNGDSFEMFSEKAPTKPIGDKYKEVTMFIGEYTPVVKENEGIKYIDKQGNVKYELPLEYKYATAFQYGYSLIYKTTEDEEEISIVDSNFMIYHPKGFKIHAIAGDNKFLASKEGEDALLFIIDHDGKIKAEAKNAKSFSANLMYYIYEDDDLYGVKSINGEIIIRAKYSDISLLDNQYILVKNEDGYGILNYEGELIIKNKFEMITSLRDGRFVAKRDKDGGYGLLDIKEERLIKYDYEYLYFLPGSDKLYGEKEDDKSKYILDAKGNVIAEFAALTTYCSYGYVVESDYFDVESVCRAIFIPEKGKYVKKLFDFSEKTASAVANKLDLSVNNDDIIRRNNYEYLPSQELYGFKYGSYKYQLGFNQIVEAYKDYSYSYYYPTTRYRYASDSHCLGLRLIIEFAGKASNHIDKIKKELGRCIQNFGFPNVDASDKEWPMYYNDEYMIYLHFTSNDELIIDYIPKK